MDSFPESFLSHLQPLLFIAGLDQTEQDDGFNALLASLKQSLTHKSHSFPVWDPLRGSSSQFHAVVVDKHTRFPPRKAKATSPNDTTPGLHSPISPLTPNSPLHPDGMMAPIWIRKHREMIPCVFVLVLKLWEPSEVTEENPLSPPSQANQQGSELERKKDAELVSEVLERKRQTAERGIKLAVVVLASSRMLDDPSLDYRLSIIRRQSGLDSRASLFVISPVAQAEVQKFVASLQSELYESAIDYYREHGRRVRRKRSRVPSSTVSRPIGGASTAALTLSGPAWSVRYEYKMAVFAEFRQEFDVALKHYEDCYNALADLFGSTAALPPRTKRWAEAKVLADCISMKIIRLYLYGDDSQHALAQFNKHVARFRQLCEGWGIGAETFEFWSWLSKQYRLFAEILDTAMHGGFKLPSSSKPATNTRAARNNIQGVTNPGLLLQHPGHFYYSAAQCSIERYNIFTQVLESEKSEDSTAAPDVLLSSPAFVHEKKVNHAEQILELLTKAYEIFKKYKSSRMALSIARQIAAIHARAKNLDIALKFHERIIKSYKKEDWNSIISSLLQDRAKCAEEDGQVAVAIQSYLELLDSDTNPSQDIVGQLKTLLETKSPAEDALPISVDLSDRGTLSNIFPSFDQTSSHINSTVNLFINAQLSTHLTQLDAIPNRLSLKISDGSRIVLQHKEGSKVPNAPVVLPSVSPIDISCDLSVSSLSQVAIQIPLASTTPATLSVASGESSLQLHGWHLNLVRSYPLSSNANECQITTQLIEAKLHVEAATSALLDEKFDITIKVESEHNTPFNAVLNVMLKPATLDQDRDTISISDETPSSFLHAVPLGSVQPHSIISKTLQLSCFGVAGLRTLDISVECQQEANSSEASTSASRVLLQTVSIPTVSVCEPTFQARYRRKRRRRNTTLDLEESSNRRGTIEVDLSGILINSSEAPIEVLNMQVYTSGEDAPVLLESDTDKEDFPMLWQPGEAYSTTWLLEAIPQPEVRQLQASSGTTLELAWRRQGSAARNTTLLAIPALDIPRLEAAVEVNTPKIAHIHKPITASYRIINDSISDMLYLAFNIDSSEQWVLSGPRQTEKISIMPGTEHCIKLGLVPVGMCGEVELPPVRVTEYARGDAGLSLGALVEAALDDGTEKEGWHRVRELDVVQEGALLGIEGTSPCTLLVVP